MVKTVKKNFNRIHEKHIKPHHENRKITNMIDSGVATMGLLSSIMAFPQVLKVYSTHNIASLTPITWIAAFLASMAWLGYGVFYKSKPILISTSISLMVNALMVFSFILF